MDEDDVRLVDDVEGVYKEIERNGSVHPLQGFLLEHKCDPEHVLRFYRLFVSKHKVQNAIVYKTFSEFFLQARFYDEMVSSLSLWVGFLESNYSLEDCMKFVECFNRIHGSAGSVVTHGDIYGKVLETLLGLSWLLNRKGALFESYVVVEKICTLITAVGKPSSRSAAISYLELLSEFFIESNMLFSYVNAVNILVSLDRDTLAKQCSLEDLELVCSYSEIKNEGDKYRKLFCKIRFCTAEEILNNVRDRCSDVKIREETLVMRKFDSDMWKRYASNIGEWVSVEGNMELIAFMKKNDFSFVVEEGMARVGEYKHKTVERKVFEIVDEYQERAEHVSKPVAVERISRQEAKAVHKEEGVQRKKTVKFVDRFTLPHKKMELYFRHYMNETEGIRDLWYEKRNERGREVFDEVERIARENRRSWGVYKDAVDRMRSELSRKIEENSRIKEPVRSTGRSKHWRDEDDNSQPFKPSYQRTSGAYMPPVGAYKQSSSRYVPPSSGSYSRPSESVSRIETHSTSDGSQRSRASRNNSWYSDDSKQSEKND